MLRASWDRFRDWEDTLLGELLRLVLRFWWVLPIASAAGLLLGFLAMDMEDRRYQSRALLLGWHDASTGSFVSNRMLEARLNSPDLLRAVLAELDSEYGDWPFRSRNPILAQWVSGQNVLTITAETTDPILSRDLLAGALARVFADMHPTEEVLERRRLETRIVADALAILHDAKASIEAEIRKEGAMGLRFPHIGGLEEDIQAYAERLELLHVTPVEPSEALVLQAPTLAEAPLPSRVWAVAILSAMGAGLVGMMFLMLAASVRMIWRNSTRAGVA